MIMESYAFWYKVKNSVEKEKRVSAIMNFNLWCECNWGAKSCLDVGFKISNLQYADELYFFIPFEITENEKGECIQDLGCKLKETELVDAIFNERHSTTLEGNSKTIRVERLEDNRPSNDDDTFYVYQLDVIHDIELENFAEGTILKIKTDSISRSVNLKNPDFYLRFRIRNHALSNLIHKYATPKSSVQNLFNETYMIDFRFHNIRSLNKTLIERFEQPDTEIVGITALHFLLMTKAYIDVNINQKNVKSIRKIEHGVWKNYVDGKDTEDLLAYHFADKAKQADERTGDETLSFLPSSEFFAKFRVEKSVFWKYLLFTLSLGVLGSIVGTIILEQIIGF